MLSRERLVAFLRKALAAERSGGFRDRAVAGGLARLAVTLKEWEAKAGVPGTFPADLLRKLAVYGKVAPASRPAAVESLERLLTGAGRAFPIQGRMETDSPLGSSAPEPSPGVKFTPGPPDDWCESGPRSKLGVLGSVNQPSSPLLIAGSRVGLPPWRGSGGSAPGRGPGTASPASALGNASDSSPPRSPASRAARPSLDSPVTCLKGVKEQRAELLARLGVRTVRELVQLLPARHEDRSQLTPLAALAPGVTATVRARVERVTRVPLGRRRERFEALLADGTGQIEAVWFNQPWLAKAVTPGLEALFHGTVREHAGRVELSAPELERLPGYAEDAGTGGERLVPVYPLTAGLHRRTLARMVGEALQAAAPCMAESLPAELLERLEMPGAVEAITQAHRPAGATSLERALERLRFEELFFLELAVAVKRHLFTEGRPGAAFEDTSGLVDRLRRRLPFALTGAQERAIGEILADLAAPRAMARLVQGDVGSGKTAVALAALMAAAGGGWQGALMAPTEILAGQHYLAIRRLCAELGVGVELLVGSQRTRERRDALEAISSGRSAVAVGTHALLEGGVEFRRLGLAIVDEQHRFGVNQRATLRAKGGNPNLLVMTATPIPRTLALTLYGDLDVSVLDEMPPGRQPIVTRSLPMERVERAYERLRAEVAAGRQGYVVCPLVEESETLEAQAAERTYEEVRERWLPGLRVHLLHGRMGGAEKARVMDLMRNREADVLVATTVVEVGVDLPDATVMIVLDAERFGLAQLHQLRGRIGRGSHASAFYPVVGTKSRAARERMAVLEGTSDGFVVAEKDLRLRGPGEFFGTRQSGLESLRIASLPRDLRLLEQARREAFALVARDPGLEAPALAATRAELFRRHGGFVERRH